MFSSRKTNIVDAAQGGFLPLASDPPAHTAYRHILQPLFSPVRMKALDVEIRRLVGGLLDNIGPKGECEFIGEVMTDDELYRTFFLLMVAGLHTVQGALGWSLMHLSQRPEERQRLIDDPSLLSSAVEEMLRYEAAVSPGRKGQRRLRDLRRHRARRRPARPAAQLREPGRG